ncbi:MAG: T9SS type A sorting domain-containing protein [Lentimicrobiaceae bacterium]|nr:T9SS type A sorting domain-containing protein [Lentimicrobiaceae bacterium]
MKNTRIIKTKITRITSVMLFLVCSLYGLSVVAQNNSEFNKPKKQIRNIERPQSFDDKLPVVNMPKSYIDWWEPDTIYIYANTYAPQYILFREVNTYNQYGYMLTNLCQTLENNEWRNIHKYTYTYNENNKILTNLWQRWENAAWANIELLTYTYDAFGKLTTILYQNWRNNEWLNCEKYNYISYPDSNLLTKQLQTWKDNAWAYHSQITYTFDENNNLLTEFWREWQNDVMTNKYYVSYTYDTNNNVLTELWQIWQDLNWDKYWKNIHKYTYTYDSNNNTLTELHQDWQRNGWLNITKYAYSFDANNNMLTELQQLWRNNAWVNKNKLTNTYDVNNNKLTEIFQTWQGAWVNINNINNTYDENNNCTLTEHNMWENESWQLSDGHLKMFYNNMKSELIFHNCFRVTSTYKYYKKLEKERIELPNVSIYPNPTNNSFVVDAEGEINVKLYDMSGKEVLSQNSNGKVIINISHLQNGVYNVQVFSGNNIIGYCKVVKQ